MTEPVSTISNLAFVIVGLIIFRKSWYVGLATMVLGIASGGWHWTLDRQWQAFDVIMMYVMLIGLIDYAEGSLYTITAIVAGVLMVGIHFLLPSHLLILAIAMLLLISMFRNYPAELVVVIAFWFILWIATNLPYLRGWSFPFDVLDILHGISHICASVGIYLTIKYRPSDKYQPAKIPQEKSRVRTFKSE